MDERIIEALSGIDAGEANKGDTEAEESKGAGRLRFATLQLTRQQYNYRFQCLAHVPLAALRLRAAVLTLFNDLLVQVLPILDLDCTCAQEYSRPGMCAGPRPSATHGCLGALLRKLPHCVLPSIKEPVLVRALKATKGSGGQAVNVSLDNFKALAQRDAAVGNHSFEPCDSECTFSQALLFSRNG